MRWNNKSKMIRKKIKKVRINHSQNKLRIGKVLNKQMKVLVHLFKAIKDMKLESA